MDSKLKHLEFIQGVINRLASDSFRMKGWTVVLVAALFVLLARQNSLDAGYIAIIPIIAFWILDGYFLWQERLFRNLYNDVRILDAEEINFSMNVSSDDKCSFYLRWFYAIFSATLWVFYGSLILIVLVTMVVIGGEPGEAI